MKVLLKLTAILAGLLWPLLVFAALKWELWTELLCLLALLMALRLYFSDRHTMLGRVSAVGCSIALLLCAASYFMQSHELMLWYPVVVNALMLSAFALSLRGKMSLIEQLARLKEPNLDAARVRYTRSVTKSWCLFFIVNGAVAAATVLSGSLEAWTIWNGLLSYIAIGLMFACEFVVRKIVQKRNAVPALQDSRENTLQTEAELDGSTQKTGENL